MTEFQNKSFSVYPGKDGGEAYRDNWERIYGKNKEKAQELHMRRPCGECGGSEKESDWGHSGVCSFWDAAKEPTTKEEESKEALARFAEQSDKALTSGLEKMRACGGEPLYLSHEEVESLTRAGWIT